MSDQEALTSYLAAFIEGLEQAGIKDVVISPGSRSTPLALLFAEHPNIDIYVNIDERSAGFFALGLAKASRKPVALLCTSGTAAANYYPAVVEASLSRVPLIVLTADRPHELRDVGAPQAIDQIHLYGRHVRWFTEMSLPEKGNTMLNYANTAATRAVSEALGLPSGPVHLNFPLREPLLPQLDPSPFLKKIATAVKRELKFGRLELPKEVYLEIAEEWRGYEKGLIVCGPLDQPGFSEAIIELGEVLGFPIFADPLSQLRSGSSSNELVIDSYDAILKTEEVRLNFQPELIIRFGGMPVSKPLSLFLQNAKNVKQVIVDGNRSWRDPYHVGTEMVYCDEINLCKLVSKVIPKRDISTWLMDWLEMNQITKNVIEAQLHSESKLDEGKAIRELSRWIPEDSIIFVGNSMPIRDMDTFFHTNKKNIRIMANRGANGIDGVISTALGSSVHSRPLFLVIGDLSFFHDMNGLLAAKIYNLNINIILLNNDGGGIFSYLPQIKEPKHFEVLFGTPTGLNFEHAVKLYHGQYTRINDWESFQVAMIDAANYEGLNVIEIPTDRAENTASHRRIWEQVSREINKYLQSVEK
ncbi:2-succinyl-5-enolpyruvyl-6-hydroxy-3-cyclohexene-1-carboxylic-acid synthase [Lederbergia lenta]|uniref:2-succinyl-5-enolpyruvyl-6-hydroxy-3- cyclohexene-1-carboxylic-acid synthase n=1 Tax=Lederbergia lenta TaxID=1467 RepID=UPI0020410215|nr:2-succinyl-5-enolpyruvyl-6-hydroxy-3-cyclohexene-1-carboxylic-acid synthase [Lederbergia lenta]MCM3113442.1 2-succinyl-5-enolpyruvyl-6-hydroxy-3-cyclohexene-1-carboxylic-acid synthase [Lederbergia lenta]